MTETTAPVARPARPGVLEQVVLQGDLAGLSPQDRVRYYAQVCESQGLNPLTRPLEYLALNGKLLLYARKDATDQLRKRHNVSIAITAREHIEGVYVVTARATLPGGRTDESTGAVGVSGLKGDALANAYMKSETKAKRRVTLSICGLGMLDESEVETIPEARPAPEGRPANGHAPALEHRPTAQPPAASPANARPKAPSLPANGEELDERLKDRDAALHQQGVAGAGELIQHVRNAGLAAGYSANLTEWTGPAILLAVEQTRAFVKAHTERVTAAEAVRLDRLAAEAGYVGDALGALVGEYGVRTVDALTRARARKLEARLNQEIAEHDPEEAPEVETAANGAA